MINSYQDRLQPIKESDVELSNTYNNYRNDSIQGSYYYGQDSMNSNGKVLNSINYNNIPYQQQSQYNSLNFSQQKSQDQNQLVSKYLQKSKAQNIQHSQQKMVGSANEDIFASQNNFQSKLFLDENSIDMSFINFLNRDDGNAVNTNMSRAQFTNRNHQSNMPSFNSNAQISTIQNINSNNNLTFPGQAKPSQIVQEKYNIGMQNINDLANLLVSNNPSSDKQIQPKFQDVNLLQKKPISQQYDEIMTKYSSALQSSQDGKLTELEQPTLYQYNSVKVNENSNDLMQFQDSLLQTYGSDASKSIVQEKRISQSESINSVNNTPYQDTIQQLNRQRQYTFENNNLQNARQVEFQGLNNEPNIHKPHQKTDSLGYLITNQGNSFIQTPTLLSQPQINNSEANIQNNNNIGSTIPTVSNNFDDDNKVKRSQQNQNQFINESYGENQTIKQTPQLSKQSSGNQNLIPPLQLSQNSQQYDSIASKYLPSKTQNIQQQYIYNSGIGQSQQSQIGSSMAQTNGLTNVSTDGRNSQRDRGGSINKLVTASELLQNFSSPKSEVRSPSSHQHLGTLQNQLVQSSATEKFNIFNSPQSYNGIKESNNISNYNMNKFELNSNQPYLPTIQQNQETQENEVIPQYKPLLLSNNNESTNIINNTAQISLNSPKLQNKNIYQQDYLSQNLDQINISKNLYDPSQGNIDLGYNQMKTHNEQINFENEFSKTNNGPQYTPFNNHIQQMNTYQYTVNPSSQQISRKQSENSDVTKILQITQENLNFQRKPSHEKLHILDSKSLLQLRDQQLQQGLQQQGILQQQYVKQSPYLFQSSQQFNCQQNQQHNPQFNSLFIQQNSQQNLQQKQQISMAQLPQQLVYSQQPYLQEFTPSYPQPVIEKKYTPQMEMSKHSQKQNSHKQFPIPENLSPIGSPENKKIQSINQIQFENELDLEINDLFIGNQNNIPSYNVDKQNEQKMQKSSKSQNIQRATSGHTQTEYNKNQNEKDTQKINHQTQASKVAEQIKPKKKIFQDNTDAPQGHKNVEQKMNQQTLKNVMNLNKNNTTNNYNSHKNNTNEQQSNMNQPKQSYSVKEVQFEEKTKKSQNNNNNASESLKNKYYIPPKSESPMTKYLNHSPPQAQIKQDNSALTSNNNLDRPSQSQNLRSLSSVKQQNKYSIDYKNHSQKKFFNIYDERSQDGSSNKKQTDNQYDITNVKRQSEQYLPYDGKLSQRSNFGYSDAKNKIKQNEEELEYEEKVKQSKMTQSKSSMKIFTNNNNSYAPSNTYATTHLKTSETPKVLDSSKANMFQPQKIFTSNNQQNQINSNITENDRKVLQMTEQRILTNNQDDTQLAIPILCIICDNFYQQKEIENHICIPSEQKAKGEQNNQPPSKQSSTSNFKSTSDFAFPQTNLTLKQFNEEDQNVNDKIQIISQKISEQPYSDEQNSIKLLLDNILQPNITYQDLVRECRNLNELNKKVENIRTRIGLSLLILSQRAEVLVKDKIDLHKRRLFPEQSKLNSTGFENKRENFNQYVQPSSFSQIDDKHMSQQSLNNNKIARNQNNNGQSLNSLTNFNQINNNQTNLNNNINNTNNNQINNTNSNNFNRHNINSVNGNSVNNKIELDEAFEMDFNFSKKEDRVQTEKQSGNINNQNSIQGNRVFTNNQPGFQHIQASKYDTPSNTSNQMNFQQNTKNQTVMSPPAMQIFNSNNIPENSNQQNNFRPSNNNPKYSEQTDLESMNTFSRKNVGSSAKLTKFDDLSSQFSSIQNLESRDLLSQNKLNKYNESSPAVYKRQFYNLALNLKLKLPPNHPARDCVISEMYNLAEKQNISENNFTTFIEGYFKQFN